MFGPTDLPDVELTDDDIAQALMNVKREVRNRRVAMVAPVVLAAAVLTAFVAAPPQHGGISLVPDAEASDEFALPQVFGANGVWRLAEPIGEAQATVPGPAWRIDVPDVPTSPDFVLDAPEEPEPDGVLPLSTPESLPVSASTPPTPTLGQSVDLPASTDWSNFRPTIRVEAIEAATNPTDDGLDGLGETEDVAEQPDTLQVAPEASERAEAEPVPANSSPDEDVSDPLAGSLPIGDADVSLEPSSEDTLAADAEASAEANPSTPQPEPSESETQPSSAVATIVPLEVLVHSAHVSVTVQVLDDDSSVIDWCNTRVDWGDGSVTGLLDADGVAACAAPCERVASPSGVGIAEEITFTHEYTFVIDAAPRVFVATGDGCDYMLAEMQLNQFTVVPY